MDNLCSDFLIKSREPKNLVMYQIINIKLSNVER